MIKVLLILILLIPVRTVAQEQFVEVIIEDSIQIEPDEYYFTVMVQEDFEVTDSASDTDIIASPKATQNLPPTTQKENRLVQLDQLIKNLRIDTVNQIQLDIMGERYPNTNFYKTLRFNSKAKLAEFVNKAKLIPGVTGIVTRLTSSQYEKRLSDLSKKLLEKCKAKAAYISSQAHKTLGSIQQVKEESADEKGGWTMYAPLSALYQTQMPANSESIVVWKKMTVRFVWK